MYVRSFVYYVFLFGTAHKRSCLRCTLNELNNRKHQFIKLLNIKLFCFIQTSYFRCYQLKLTLIFFKRNAAQSLYYFRKIKISASNAKNVPTYCNHLFSVPCRLVSC